MTPRAESPAAAFDLNISDAAAAAVLAAQFKNCTPAAAKKMLTETGVEAWTADDVSDYFFLHDETPPYVGATEKSTGRKGTLVFVARPRVYFSFFTEQENE